MTDNLKIERNLQCIKTAFREYYFNHGKNIWCPDKIDEREFGFMYSGSGMNRHKSFKSKNELLAFLIKETPLDVYYSSGYYRYPTNPIQEKEWLGADLVFDIDGKDLNLECEAKHTYLKCNECRTVARARDQVCCSSCASTKLSTVSIPCSNCNVALKKEVNKLVKFLVDDFGIPDKLIEVFFSGNNGFHVHVIDEKFRTLDGPSRSQIVEYIMGKGFVPESIGIRKTREGLTIKIPRGGIKFGWRSKIAPRLKVTHASENKLHALAAQMGSYDDVVKEIFKITSRMGVLIDGQVTSDVHRIFRMPGTLNSKSGLAKISCVDIENFDPFTDACFIADKVIDMNIYTPVDLDLKNEKVQLERGNAKLPLYAATYIILKGLGSAV